MNNNWVKLASLVLVASWSMSAFAQQKAHKTGIDSGGGAGANPMSKQYRVSCSGLDSDGQLDTETTLTIALNNNGQRFDQKNPPLNLTAENFGLGLNINDSDTKLSEDKSSFVYSGSDVQGKGYVLTIANPTSDATASNESTTGSLDSNSEKGLSLICKLGVTPSLN